MPEPKVSVAVDHYAMFMAKVIVLPFVECWLWIGSGTAKGYGRFWNGSRVR